MDFALVFSIAVSDLFISLHVFDIRLGLLVIGNRNWTY